MTINLWSGSKWILKSEAIIIHHAKRWKSLLIWRKSFRRDLCFSAIEMNDVSESSAINVWNLFTFIRENDTFRMCLYAMLLERWKVFRETPHEKCGTSGGASLLHDSNDIDNEICAKTFTYRRQAWSFVALMMKSSHSGLEFCKEEEMNWIKEMWQKVHYNRS